MVRLTATEAARSFSDVLNRVAAGEEFEIVRNGAPVARLTPAPARGVSSERLLALLDRLPPLDEAFADDIRAIRADRAAADAGRDPWAS